MSSVLPRGIFREFIRSEPVAGRPDTYPKKEVPVPREIRIAILAVQLVFAACFHMAHPDTPLTLAAAEGRTDQVASLLARGAVADDPDSHGWTPLMWAARAGRIEVMKALIDAGADLNGRDRCINGWTALMHAVHEEQTRSVRILLDLGANPNAASANGTTPLMIAAGQGEIEIVGLLLERGADPRARNIDRINALTNAVAGGHTEIVRLLLDRAHDLEVSDNIEGKISVWIARLRGRTEILRMIEGLRHGA